MITEFGKELDGDNKEKKRIIVFGLGCGGEEFLKSRRCYLRDKQIIAFSDNDRNKTGQLFHGYPVITPEEIPQREYDLICVASAYYKEISKQLINEIGVPRDKIHTKEYFWDLYGRNQRRKHYDRFPREAMLRKGIDVTDEPMVVYTAIFGGKDYLEEPEFTGDGIEYICFTDDKSIQSNTWRIEYRKGNDANPRRSAKIFKVKPHVFLPNYKLSVWIDGNMKIRGDMREYVKRYMKYTHMLLAPHPWRDCAYEEAEKVISLGYDDPRVVEKQIAKYRSEGFPEHAGLCSMGLIARWHMETDVINAMEQWWREIETYSQRDQLSFRYVAWKQKLAYDISPLFIYRNKYLEIGNHRG